MFFDRLFLRVALTLFCSMFCASEMLAVPPGQDLPTSNISTKRKVSESRRLPQRDPGNPFEALSTTGIFISEPSVVGLTSAKEEHESVNKKHKNLDQDEVFWAEAVRAADAAEEEYYRNPPGHAPIIATPNPIDDAAFWAAAIVAADSAEEEYHREHPQESPAISLDSEQPVQQLLSSPSARAPSLPEPEGHSPLAQRALSGTTDDELIYLLNEVEGDLRQVSPSSLAVTQKNKMEKKQRLASSSASSGHSTAPLAKKEPSLLSPTHLAVSQGQRAYLGAKFDRIIGNEEHIEELVSLIASSKRKLEIFSWTLGYLDDEVFDALREASDRGVQIILTVQDVKRESTLECLEEADIQINCGRQTHTKFLISDDRTAMIGSYNFLGAGAEDEEIEGVGESSFRISGSAELVKRIRGRIYRDMICYEKGESSLLTPLYINLSLDSNFYLLTNLLHHEEFFKSMGQIAKQRIIIYSPFINYRNAVRRLQILQGKIDPNVKLLIYVQPKHAQNLEWALKKCSKLKGRTTIKESSFHRKSLIIDPESSENCHFCDGSFNWLCAATDIDNETSNQETSVVLSGHIARDHLQDDEIDF